MLLHTSTQPSNNTLKSNISSFFIHLTQFSKSTNHTFYSLIRIADLMEDESVTESMQAEAEQPHDALFLVLAYLPVLELLNMTQTCVSLRDAVNKDVLPWLNIIIERPLSSRLSDEILMKITSKADGKLRSLIIRNCVKITDYGLQRVVEENPYINKLHLPGCTSLTPEGIIIAVKTLSQQPNSLKSLQINGIYNLNKQHLQTLSSCLRTDPAQKKPHPILYHHYRINPSSTCMEKDRIIDVDVCVKCDEVQMVFDCSRGICRQKRDRGSAGCRGCNFCITRCEECGGCVVAEEQEDTACADVLCSDCWIHLPKCNHCNKPYCKRHANQLFSSSGCIGFVCEACHVIAIGDSIWGDNAVE
ncbi:F-box protein SKIP28 [Mercurialis annua]|uniref:F-box protein SKIP28 n=1 Tax=Mercurialis annua TaxID=3986 RepID=UPI00215DD8A9|nr:F-box protein SKIP28 [Mercurialis annua]